jgi:hypothetical protein
MELAVHIRDLDQTKIFHNIFGQLKTFYNASVFDVQDWSDMIIEKIVRVYIGDEFCIHRLPSLDELDALLRVIKTENAELTLLIPPLTDEGIERSIPLLNVLNENDPQAEVVVNDWGVLLFLQQNYPFFRLSVGRLLNKGFKDPRLMDLEEASQFSAETAELFNRCTFDSDEFLSKLQEMNVRRLERDLLPYGELEIQSHGGLETSVYFPFGYISTGRVCWMATFNASAEKKLSISNGCRRPCKEISLNLDHDGTNLPLFQAGNTIFYLYAPSKLAALLKQAKSQNLRLVYQGLMM